MIFECTIKKTHKLILIFHLFMINVVKWLYDLFAFF